MITKSCVNPPLAFVVAPHTRTYVVQVVVTCFNPGPKLYFSHTPSVRLNSLLLASLARYLGCATGELFFLGGTEAGFVMMVVSR